MIDPKPTTDVLAELPDGVTLEDAEWITELAEEDRRPRKVKPRAALQTSTGASSTKGGPRQKAAGNRP